MNQPILISNKGIEICDPENGTPATIERDLGTRRRGYCQPTTGRLMIH